MKYKISNYTSTILISAILISSSLTAQVASHAASGMAAQPAAVSLPSLSTTQISDRPVARVNGAVLTDRDLVREMYTIFPYAKQHNGFPKAQEAAIRQGALEMIIFEELVYQEAERRKLTVPAARVRQGEEQFKKQFNSPDEYAQYLQLEVQGSPELMRKRIQRSLLIEQVLKGEVDDKAFVSLAEVRAYYDKNPTKFSQGEAFSIQSISILPPAKPGPDFLAQNRKRAEDALKQAKTTKSYEEFGLLAEKLFAG